MSFLTRSWRRYGVAAAATGVALAGCGAGVRSAAAPLTAPASCTNTVDGELKSVARRIYGQQTYGRDAAGAVARVERSQPVVAAVAHDDAAATRAALRPLLRADIRHIEVSRGGHVLAAYGSGPGLGPVHGTLRSAAGATVGRFTLATGTDSGFAGLIGELTGAQVVMRSGTRTVYSSLPAGADTSRYTPTSLPATAYPSGSLRIELLLPAVDPALCGPTAAVTDANTVGAVGRRLYADETSGPGTKGVLAFVAQNPRFIRAVEERSPSAVRAQIVRFFQDPHLHVVRIRARAADGRLINDVGGPYVLAPATTAVRSHGRTVGSVTLSTQDDTGYIKLMHRFTDADVVLRTAHGEVPGSTLSTGSALPDQGAVTVDGRRYEAYSFDATAFPSGTLRISLLRLQQ